MKNKVHTKYMIEFIILRIVQVFIASIPRKMALKVGGKVGLVLYYLGLYRKVVRKNMSYTGFFDIQKYKGLEKKIYVTIGRYSIDFLRPMKPLPPLSIKNFDIVKPILNKAKALLWY